MGPSAEPSPLGPTVTAMSGCAQWIIWGSARPGGGRCRASL